MTIAAQPAPPTTEAQPPKPATGPALWHRQPGESPKAFHAWTLYLNMSPPRRSIAAVHKKIGKSARYIQKWSSIWKWQERLAAYTQHQTEMEQAALDQAARDKAQQWAVREQQWREQQYQIGQQMIERAQAIMALPIKRITHRTKGKGKGQQKVTITEPVNVNMAQAARLADVGNKLVNLSVGSPTERTALTGKDGESVLGAGAASVVIYLPEKEK